MKEADLPYLLRHDSQICWETPLGFNQKAALAEVRALIPALSEIAGHPLQLDDQIQDASFFADLSAYDPVPRSFPGCSSAICTIVNIRFSSFGRLFALGSSSPDQQISAPTQQLILEFLAARQFVYAPESLLDQPYHRPDFIATWWIRYFDYL